MAFNLNKNDGSMESSASKTKFDLTKNITPVPATTEPVKKSNVLSYLALIILVVGGAIWYLVSDKSPSTEKSASAGAGHDIVDTVPVAQISPQTVDATDKMITKVPVSFAQGATTFRTLDESIVREIVKHLASSGTAKLEVLGYASSEGSPEVNQSISQARADAFKSYLLSKHVVGDRIVAIGKGIENPIASNETELGRKKNRRVEVKLY